MLKRIWIQGLYWELNYGIIIFRNGLVGFSVKLKTGRCLVQTPLSVVPGLWTYPQYEAQWSMGEKWQTMSIGWMMLPPRKVAQSWSWSRQISYEKNKNIFTFSSVFSSEAIVWSSSLGQMFWKISQNLWENTCEIFAQFIKAAIV